MNISFDPNSQDFISDPYAYLSELAAQNEVVKTNAQGVFVVLSYNLVKKIITDSSLSVRYIPKHMDKLATSDISSLKNLGKYAIVFTDPPQHQRLRRLHMPMFNKSSVGNLDNVISHEINSILNQIEKNKRVDIVKELSDSIPRTVMSELLGIKVEDRYELSDLLLEVRTLLEPVTITPRKLKNLEIKFQRCLELIQKNIEYNKRNPSNNFISQLLNVRDKNDKLTNDELQISCALTYIAGHETTKSLISSTAHLFSTFPSEWEKLTAADEVVLESAVNEIIRYEPPLHFTTRLATKDFKLVDNQISSGDLLLLCIASANRDNGIYENAGTFDIDRNQTDNLSFGMGMHNCIGKHIAKKEVSTLLRLMLEKSMKFYKSDECYAKWAKIGPTTRTLESLFLEIRTS